MRYTEFRDKIQQELLENSAGLTWAQLKNRLALPYDNPCPTWINRLEQEIGLLRSRESGRAFVWKIGK
ncbi:MAG: hypothetical protein A2161_11310 [Candidatus Schekmanbacteria bacterium RBG_13_48_7]|uniref:HTH HARE-type domain-containing protein n=1 Tax=Candidatus Schekmanbacteria bacterium RBG_13_48_7 TaxID=1817878 RepID=A0A1F7RTM0_9BACT|nr:MAG: hypothetical protein A2161_11310 [Candidatus Schekmanbacteria bacterium RBG_13_48_7]